MCQFHSTLKPRGGGGGGYLGLQVTGMVIEWWQTSRPKKIPRASSCAAKPPKMPGPKINPKKISCQISDPLKFQKGLNDIMLVKKSVRKLFNIHVSLYSSEIYLSLIWYSFKEHKRHPRTLISFNSNIMNENSNSICRTTQPIL